MAVITPYKDYRESGVCWLENIPSHWGVTKFKRYCDIKLGKMLQPQPNAPTDIQVPYLRAIHVQWERVEVSDLPEMWASEAELKKFQVKSGDLLVCEGGEVGRTAILTNVEGDCIIQNALHRIRGNANTYAPYINYLMRHIADAKWFEILCSKATIAHLTGEKLGELGLPLPSIEEQQAIACFLDFKTAQIDALITKKQILLDKLAEKRTALISHAVTKGLDPSVPMKDSGVAWLGNIPAHWQRMLMVRIISKFEQGWSPSCDEREASLDEWGILKSGCVNYGVFQERDHKTLPPSIDPIPSLEVKVGDILMCRASGSKHLIGSVAMVRKCRSKLIFSDKTYRIALQSNSVDPEFFVLLMKSKYLRDQIELSISGADGLANNIPQSSVKGYQIVLPPTIEEQQTISTYLKEKIEGIEAQEGKIFEVIERLQEYRSALITNTVTGKIDVRGFLIPQSAEDVA